MERGREGDGGRKGERESERENMENLVAKFVHLQLIGFKCDSFLELIQSANL